MNIWRAMFFAIWGPIFTVLTPIFVYPSLSSSINGIADFLVFAFIFGLFGAVIADMLMVLPAKAITKVM